MEFGESEHLAIQPGMNPGAVERLADESLKLSSELLSRHLLSTDFSDYSPNLDRRIADEIRLSKQAILSGALNDEWNMALDNDFPLHRAVGLEVPQNDDSPDFISRWQQPLIVPELPDSYVNACLSYIYQRGVDFRDLDDIHRDYADKPKLFGLLQSIDSLTQRGYKLGTGDIAYEIVKDSLFDQEYTLEYDGSLFLLAYLPQDSAKLVMNMMTANQISTRMEEVLHDADLDETEQNMLNAMRAVLKAEALTGPAWYDFAAKYGGIKIYGAEQTEISADGLLALLQVRRLARRRGVNRVSKAYLTAVESACYGVLGMIETVSVNDFAVGDPSEIARAQFNSPLRMVLSSDRRIQNAVQPIKSGLKAVIVDETVTDSLIADLIINEQTPCKTNEDFMHRKLDPSALWVTDPSIAQANIAINEHNPAYFLDYIKSILDTRMKMADDQNNPDFNIVIWSSTTETVATAYEWFAKLAMDDDSVRAALLSGELIFEAPYHFSERTSRVRVRVQPKQAILPRPNA